MRLPRARRSARGSALITVIVFTGILLVLGASILRWSLNERRLNLRNAYWLEARNAAEAVAEYGFSQIVTRYNNYATPPSLDPSGAMPLVLPPDAFFTGGNVVTGAASSRNPNGLTLIGGTAISVPAAGTLYYIDPENPDNQGDTLKSQYVNRRDIQVIAKATVIPPFGPPITACVTEKVSIRGAPLFAHAIFYSNNDLEAAPGPTLDIYGPVHVNGNMFPLAQGTVETGTANSVNFRGPVSLTGNIYHAWANQKPASQGRGYSSSAATMDGEPLGEDPVTFINSADVQVNLKDNKNIWNDSTMGAADSLFTSQGRYLDTTTPALDQLQTQLSTKFRSYAAQTWGGNLQTSAMGVQSYNPIAFTQPIDSVGTLPDPHAIIDAPAAPPSDDPYYSAKTEVENQKFANQVGLYVRVVVTPGANGTADTGTITLYGPANSAPEETSAAQVGPNGGIKLGSVPANLVTFIPYKMVATGTIATPSTQKTYAVSKISATDYRIVTTTKTGATSTQAATFTYTGTSTAPAITPTGTATLSGGTSSAVTGTTKYATSAAATAALPAASVTPVGSVVPTLTASTTNVGSGLYDQRQLAGINLVQIDMAALRAALASANTGTKNTSSITTSAGTVWGSGSNGWNGGIYVEIVSATGTAYPGQTSVIVANGKTASGTSLLPATNAVTGLLLATNGPLYVAGNFNADGANATTATSATTPDDGKTNALGSPVSAQIPVALAADSITLLSANYFSAAGANGSSVPAINATTTSAYTSYKTASPAASGSIEVASAFITGIVATNNATFSGGVHNLPRFIENWGTNAVAIRGSLVSLFKSKIATGPWAQRYYSAPKRIWGFDQTFSNGTFPPLTPKVMSYRRVDFSDLSPADYEAARKTLWPGL